MDLRDRIMKWLTMSDQELRLKIGEASAQEIRTLRAVLRLILVEGQ